jgi:hypothetical protein
MAESGLDACTKSAEGRDAAEGRFSLGIRKGDVARGARVGIRPVGELFNEGICGWVAFDGRRLTRGRSELGRPDKTVCGCTCG